MLLGKMIRKLHTGCPIYFQTLSIGNHFKQSFSWKSFYLKTLSSHAPSSPSLYFIDHQLISIHKSAFSISTRFTSVPNNKDGTYARSDDQNKAANNNAAEPLLPLQDSLKHSIHNSELSEKPKISEFTKENIATIPNILTASRMILAPVIGYLVLNQNYDIAMILFAFAGVTDLLDGHIARNFPNQASRLGMAIDPLADKLLMTIVTISLTSVDLFPATLMVLIITRDVLLVLSGFALRFFSLPPPKTIQRYFDISLPSAEVYPTFSSKLNTMVQLFAIAASLGAPLVGLEHSVWLKALWILTGVTTVWSGASYAFNGATCFKILEEKRSRGFGMKQIQMVGGVGFSLGVAFVCWKSLY